LNNPDPIDDFLGIHVSHQDNGELHMSQTGLIDAVTESAHIPKGQLKNTPPPATAILHADTDGLASIASKDPGTIPPLSDNSTSFHKILGQIYNSQFSNAHDFLRNLKLYVKRQ
jgi:hypothetical protein